MMSANCCLYSFRPVKAPLTNNHHFNRSGMCVHYESRGIFVNNPDDLTDIHFRDIASSPDCTCIFTHRRQWPHTTDQAQLSDSYTSAKVPRGPLLNARLKAHRSPLTIDPTHCSWAPKPLEVRVRQGSRHPSHQAAQQLLPKQRTLQPLALRRDRLAVCAVDAVIISD